MILNGADSEYQLRFYFQKNKIFYNARISYLGWSHGCHQKDRLNPENLCINSMFIKK